MRPQAVILAALCAAAGCSALTGTPKRPDTPLGRAKRLAVVPFTDSLGLGRSYAHAVSKQLWTLDFDVVSTDQLDQAFRHLGMKEGEPLGLHDLIALRKITRADAVVYGAMLCPDRGQKRVSILMLETIGGRTIFRHSFRPRRCGTRRDVEDVARRVRSAVKAAFARERVR